MILLQNLQQPLNGNRIIFLLLFLTLNVFAQSKNDFTSGLESYKRGDYSKAVFYFENYLKVNKQFSEQANFLLIMSYFRLNNFDKAKRRIIHFEQNFPNSEYLPLLIETKLAIAIYQQDLEEIKNCLLNLEDKTIKKSQLKGFIGAFKKISSFPNRNVIESLIPGLKNSTIKFAFYKAQYDLAIDQRKTESIKKYYHELIKINNSLKFFNISKIGVLIPKESNNNVELSIIEGIKFANHNFNELRAKGIELKIYKGTISQLEVGLEELAKDIEVLCVIGPLYSAQFKKLAPIANELCIPLISPTATAKDISVKSKYIFQFNPTLDVRGNAMIKYSIEKLKFSRFAIISSENQTTKIILEPIRKKIKQVGAKLIADINWNEDTKFLRNKIRELRKKALEQDLVIKFDNQLSYELEIKLLTLGLEQKLIDSLREMEAEVSIYELFGKDADKLLQKNKVPVSKRIKNVLDDLSVPVFSIDAIFIPLMKSEVIPDLVNELERQNIVTKLIGNDIWYSINDLFRGYPATNGVLFTSDFYFDTDDGRFKDIADEVYKYTKMQPNRTFFYGFETMNKILDNWNSDINRENFFDKLIKDKSYTGFVSDIILNSDGINSAVFIMEYRNRKVKKIDRVITEIN